MKQCVACEEGLRHMTSERTALLEAGRQRQVTGEGFWVRLIKKNWPISETVFDS